MFLQIIFIILLGKLEKEYIDKSFISYLLDPIAKSIYLNVSEELPKVLRSDILLIVNHNTSSIFRHGLGKEFNGLVKLEVVNSKFKYEPFNGTDTRLLFLLDKELLWKYEELEQNNKIVFFKNTLLTDKCVHSLIAAYHAIKKYDLNTNYYEFEIKTKNFKKYKDVTVHIKKFYTIRNTIYNEKCEFLEKLCENFEKFWKSKNLQHLHCYEISELYMQNVLDFLREQEILLNVQLYDTYVIEKLFPFVFFRNIHSKITDQEIISGGICLDDRKFLMNFKKGRNFHKYAGKRYIFSYLVTSYYGINLLKRIQ